MPGSLQRGRLPFLVAAVLTAALITPAQAAGPLLSQNRPVTASSSESSVFAPSAAVDGDPGTHWSSEFRDPQHIQIDLGSVALVDQVTLAWETAHARAFTLRISPDGNTWHDVHTTTTGPGGTQTLPVAGTGRYVRLDLTQRATQWGYSLWEFQVYGTGGDPTPAPPLPPNPQFPGRLVWADEFNAPAGTGPDAAKWTPETGPGVNNELQYYTNNNNARHDGNGNLVLQARREVTPGSACPPDPISGSTTCQYTSSRLDTHGKFSFTYGRVEARIRVSTSQGLWPAFWLLGADFFDKRTPWPNCGEIDVMEHVGREPNRLYSTLHAPAYHGAGGFGQPLDLNQPAAAQFHTFAVEWDSSHMTFSVDGNNFFTADRNQLESTRGPWVYDHPFFIIINNAVGGDFPGPPGPGTQLPQDMVLDYVRVFQ